MRRGRRIRFLAVLLAVLMLGAPVPAAGGFGAALGEAAAGDAGSAGTDPVTRTDGGPFRLAYVDYDGYLPASRQFYYILKGLEERGWIREGSIPFTPEEIDRDSLTTDQLYGRLKETDLGPYIAFPENGFHYLGYEDTEQVAREMKEGAGRDFDLVLTFGTAAGVFVKDLGLPVPMVDFSATDPVASGIIASSTEGSGNPNVWAQVEPSLPLRQLKYYHSLKPFSKLGIIVYADENVSGVPDILRCSEEIGFELVKYFMAEVPRETEAQRDAYYETVRGEIGRMTEEGIDAFFLTADLINDPARLAELIEPFYEKKIPVYLMDDATYVEKGVLMLISAYDNENVGRFVAEAVVRILKGAEAGSLPCVYTSAPSIYFNYDVARRIDYPVTFEFLTVCDTIYTEAANR